MLHELHRKAFEAELEFLEWLYCPTLQKMYENGETQIAPLVRRLKYVRGVLGRTDGPKLKR